MKVTRLLIGLLVLAGFALPAMAQPAKTQRIRGTVTAVSDTSITVKSRDGTDLKIALDPDWSVLAVLPLSLADIKTGSYVGIAALPQPGGEEKALEVLVFPEAARGSGEGHYPWDLMPQSTMTNATVAAMV